MKIYKLGETYTTEEIKKRGYDIVPFVETKMLRIPMEKIFYANYKILLLVTFGDKKDILEIIRNNNHNECYLWEANIVFSYEDMKDIKDISLIYAELSY